MKKMLLVTFLVALCAGIFVYVYTAEVANAPHDAIEKDTASATLHEDKNEVVADSLILPYGETGTRIGQWSVFSDVRIRPLRVVEDSRCPVDVTCIQAGTVKVELLTVSGLGTSTNTITLGETLTTEAEMVTFVRAEPEAVSTRVLTADAYVFTFIVEKREPHSIPKPDLRQVVTGACYVGGCSSQLCTDTPDAVSTCEYKEEYACYVHATCERQSSGQCGWTPTPAFNSCMDDASGSVYPQ